MLNIYKAQLSDVKTVLPLFNAYRVFYKQTADVTAAENFLTHRLKNDESIILIAEVDENAVGFTQLYTTYSSVSLLPVYILNDLYVDANYRKQGIGEALLNKAKEICIGAGFKGLALETATDNPAQKLYETLGWKKDSGSFHYFWPANN